LFLNSHFIWSFNSFFHLLPSLQIKKSHEK
jgi:hypothetical protein